jgi:protein phosphatase
LKNPIGPISSSPLFLVIGLVVAAVAIIVIVFLLTRRRRALRRSERRELTAAVSAPPTAAVSAPPTAAVSAPPTAAVSAQFFVPAVRAIAEPESPRTRSERLDGAHKVPYAPDQPLVWVASKTDPGVTRDHNEDALLVDTAAGLLLVADGVGGNRAGEVASSLAAELIAQYINGHLKDEHIENLLRESVISANQGIRERAAKNPAWAGMGSTVVAALCSSDLLYVVHVGDSRAYLINNSVMHQITRDHTVVEELIELGQLTQEEALVHPERHVITKSLGSKRPLEPELDFVSWKAGNYLLLCSDGLTDMVDDVAINAIVVDADMTLEQKCLSLVQAANQHGGEDNITVVLAYRD